MTEIERQLISQLLGERLAPEMDIKTLLAIEKYCPSRVQLNDLQLAEVQRIAKDSRRPMKDKVSRRNKQRPMAI